jgi:hypothetical protein
MPEPNGQKGLPAETVKSTLLVLIAAVCVPFPAIVTII